MDCLRPRNRPPVFSGFTEAEIWLCDLPCHVWCKYLEVRIFLIQIVLQNLFLLIHAVCSVIFSWNHILPFFGITALLLRWRRWRTHSQDRVKTCWIRVFAKKLQEVLKEGKKVPDLSELEFEARSSKDGAWYDVETFLAHTFLSSGEAEVRVRFVGFGAEEDEWVNVKKAVRVRSIPFEHSECHKVKVGDLVLCLQERRDQAIYYDAHVIEIERKMHDIRGCRCVFLIRYDHDNTEERVRLRRLCYIPCQHNR
ncbi:hypothetical protein SLEP1_g15751 [Rubroshorea leprosula]|uniref:SAWADEE domain-containing protein n=1 Tax=Rubroshorea leprosula TaxID=152421 RepID=A0AAV5IZ73_9ROSI|nr:hypothetical protein SLEP1_g15751 [Rubroshorea leprosula]